MRLLLTSPASLVTMTRGPAESSLTGTLSVTAASHQRPTHHADWSPGDWRVTDSSCIGGLGCASCTLVDSTCRVRSDDASCLTPEGADRDRGHGLDQRHVRHGHAHARRARRQLQHVTHTHAAADGPSRQQAPVGRQGRTGWQAAHRACMAHSLAHSSLSLLEPQLCECMSLDSLDGPFGGLTASVISALGCPSLSVGSSAVRWSCSVCMGAA